MARVLRGWHVWWKWHRASEGQQQWIHYANSWPLCLTSNNTALYICKAWQDTVHTGLLSKQSHARMVTPNGWPLLAPRLPGQTSCFLSTDTQLITCSSHHVSGVKCGRMLRLPSIRWTQVSGKQAWSWKNGFLWVLIIPAEVKMFDHVCLAISKDLQI